MKIWFAFGLITCVGIVHAITGSTVVSGMCTVSSIFIIALDDMKEDIIKAINQNKKDV